MKEPTLQGKPFTQLNAKDLLGIANAFYFIPYTVSSDLPIELHVDIDKSIAKRLLQE